jgi:hypothetical protein
MRVLPVPHSSALGSCSYQLRYLVRALGNRDDVVASGNPDLASACLVGERHNMGRIHKDRWATDPNGTGQSHNHH